MRHLDWFCGQDITFAEAYARTGRLVNLTCTPKKTKIKDAPPLILNHLTAPNVTLASAVCASSCVPMLIPPVPLLEKVSRGVAVSNVPNPDGATSRLTSAPRPA